MRLAEARRGGRHAAPRPQDRRDPALHLRGAFHLHVPVHRGVRPRAGGLHDAGRDEPGHGAVRRRRARRAVHDLRLPGATAGRRRPRGLPGVRRPRRAARLQPREPDRRRPHGAVRHRPARQPDLERPPDGVLRGPAGARPSAPGGEPVPAGHADPRPRAQGERLRALPRGHPVGPLGPVPGRGHERDLHLVQPGRIRVPRGRGQPLELLQVQLRDDPQPRAWLGQVPHERHELSPSRPERLRRLGRADHVRLARHAPRDGEPPGQRHRGLRPGRGRRSRPLGRRALGGGRGHADRGRAGPRALPSQGHKRVAARAPHRLGDRPAAPQPGHLRGGDGRARRRRPLHRAHDPRRRPPAEHRRGVREALRAAREVRRRHWRRRRPDHGRPDHARPHARQGPAAPGPDRGQLLGLGRPSPHHEGRAVARLPERGRPGHASVCRHPRSGAPGVPRAPRAERPALRRARGGRRQGRPVGERRGVADLQDPRGSLPGGPATTTPA